MVIVNQPVLSQEFDILLQRRGGGRMKKAGWISCVGDGKDEKCIIFDFSEFASVYYGRIKIYLNPAVDFPDCEIIQVPSQLH